MSNKLIYLVILLLIFVPLYPKFPLLGVSGTFVAIRLEDILIAAVLAILVLQAFKERFVNFFPSIGKSIWLYWLAGFVSVFSAIFVTQTATLNLGILHWARRIEYMSMFFVGFHFLKSLKQLDLVVRSLLILTLVVGIYGLGQQFLGWPVISTSNSEFAKGLALSLGAGARINSTFAGHYDLAAFCIFPLLLILGLLITKTRHKWLLLIIGALIYWTLLLTASRIAFPAFLISAGLMIIALRKPVWLFLLGFMAILGVIISPNLAGRYREFIVNHLFSLATSVEAAVDEEVPDALKPAAAPEDRSFNIRRVVEWPRAMRGFYQNPILGTGFSSVGLAVDGDYFRSLAEVGLLGSFALGMVFLRFFASSWKFFVKPEDNLAHTFIIAITCGLIGLLLNAVFIDVLEASKIAILAWLLLGVSEKVKQLV